MKKPRCTAIEKGKRLFTIQGWILDGVPDRLIVKQILQQWDIDIRQAERYVKEAYVKWSKIDGVTIENKRQMKIAEYQQRKRNIEPRFKNTPEGIRALNDIDKMIDKLEGLELAKKIQIGGDPENPLETKTKIDLSDLPTDVLLALEAAYKKK